ncbi:Multifunctional-autoprocessing repeats-in-toxin [Trichinella pseudospiralis]
MGTAWLTAFSDAECGTLVHNKYYFVASLSSVSSVRVDEERNKTMLWCCQKFTESLNTSNRVLFVFCTKHSACVAMSVADRASNRTSAESQWTSRESQFPRQSLRYSALPVLQDRA